MKDTHESLFTNLRFQLTTALGKEWYLLPDDEFARVCYVEILRIITEKQRLREVLAKVKMAVEVEKS